MHQRVLDMVVFTNRLLEKFKSTMFALSIVMLVNLKLVEQIRHTHLL